MIRKFKWNSHEQISSTRTFFNYTQKMLDKSMTLILAPNQSG